MVKNVLLVATSSALISCASQSPVASIPIEIVNGNPIASARIGDVQIDVIVDTGGFGGIAISPEDLDRLDVIFTGESIQRTDAAGETFESRAFVIPNVLLGGYSFNTVDGFERIGSASGFAGGTPINIVGRGLLHKFVVVVDYPKKEIRLYRPQEGESVCGPPHGNLILNEDDQLVLPVQTDGGRMLALMDTGATYSFVQSQVISSRNLDVIDGLYTTSTLRIGDREFGPLEMVALPINGALQIDALIGANFFSQQVVCFDYDRRTVSFPN